MKTSHIRNPIGPEKSVHRMIRISSAMRRVLVSLGFDASSGGTSSLDAFCRHRGLDTKTLLTVLRAIDRGDRELAERSPEVMTLSELCDRLECRHFELAGTFVALLAECPEAVKGRVGVVVDRVLAHLREEEDTLFPMIRELDHTGAFSGKVREELGRRLKAMRYDHGALEEALADLDDLDTGSDDFRDEGTKACLFRLTEALHGQIHEEDHVLYRRVAGLVRMPA